MKLVSTRHQSAPVSFHDALLQGLASDGGLYVPESFPTAKNYQQQSMSQLGLAIMSNFLADIPSMELLEIIDRALSFPVPLVCLEKNIYLLEVFHGPTLAFKDVGARFMANVLAYYLKKENKKVTIVVATSGDTGSAIANAFYNMPNIDVCILYPANKITFLQEQQMTTFGGNIHAMEVQGTFDDCQLLVKTALMDNGLRNGRLLSTANSINIARLLPQMIYHSWGVIQLRENGVTDHPILSVPSGNLGNLTAAVYAKCIGMPIKKFIAASNVNNVFPHYLATGKFSPRPSLQSFSNAMDVGNPSNFERLLAFYGNAHANMQKEIQGVSISDEQTLLQIRKTYEESGYILDPHTAVGVAAAKQNQDEHPIIVTATAHPAKFPDVVRRAINIDVELPERLQAVMDKPKQAVNISTQYSEFRQRLISI